MGARTPGSHFDQYPVFHSEFSKDRYAERRDTDETILLVVLNLHPKAGGESARACTHRIRAVDRRGAQAIVKMIGQEAPNDPHHFAVRQLADYPS